MKAAILREFKKPLTIEQTTNPDYGPDEVLIKVEACGVCHSDLHVAEGDWPQLMSMVKIKKPLILGHEVVGRVVERGQAVLHLDIGDRVGVALLYSSCGDCEFCKEGQENLCPAQVMTGVTVDGGFAQFMKAKASHAIKIPEALTSAEAAPLFCAGVTVYRALKKAGIQANQRVAVFGVGGLGHLAVQIAKTYGAEVLAIDIAEDKLELARTLGVDQVLNAATSDVIAVLRGLGGVHVALVTSASKAAYDIALYSLRPAGTLLVVGLPSEDLTFPAIVMASGESRFVASAFGTRDDLRETLALAASGKLQCRVETRPLHQINEIFDEMRCSKIIGRIVVTL